MEGIELQRLHAAASASAAIAISQYLEQHGEQTLHAEDVKTFFEDLGLCRPEAQKLGHFALRQLRNQQQFGKPPDELQLGRFLEWLLEVLSTSGWTPCGEDSAAVPCRSVPDCRWQLVAKHSREGRRTSHAAQLAA